MLSSNPLVEIKGVPLSTNTGQILLYFEEFPMNTLFVMSTPGVEQTTWEAVVLQVPFSKLCDYVSTKLRKSDSVVHTACDTVHKFLDTGILPLAKESREKHDNCQCHGNCPFCAKEARTLTGWKEFNSFLNSAAEQVGIDGELSAIVVNGNLVFDMFSKEEKKGFKGKVLAFSDEYGREYIG